MVDILFLFSLHLCADCAPREVQRILEAIQEVEALAPRHQKSKRLAILEFTRARDSSEDGEVKKDAEKLE